ncbi:MAG: hypothetical protein AAF198_10710 [Pseudomonadota bacterium]
MKRYAGGLVTFDVTTDAHHHLDLRIDDSGSASLFGGFRYLWYQSTTNRDGTSFQ